MDPCDLHPFETAGDIKNNLQVRMQMVEGDPMVLLDVWNESVPIAFFGDMARYRIHLRCLAR